MRQSNKECRRSSEAVGTLLALFSDYLLLERNRSRLTAESYERDLRQFFDYASDEFGGGAASDVSSRQIRSWLAAESGRGLTPRSLRRKAQSLRTFFGWMVLTERRPDNPAASLQLAKPSRPLPTFVGQEDMERVGTRRLSSDEGKNRRDHLIVELLYTCGLRQAELLGLTDSDISFDRAEMRVHGKGGKTRIIPLAEPTLGVIADWQRERDGVLSGGRLPLGQTPLFPGRDGKPLSRPRLYQIVRDALAGTSTHRRSPHTLRHSFATAMLNGGADIMTVKEILGHSSLSSTQVYTHLNFRELQRDYASAHPRATGMGGAPTAASEEATAPTGAVEEESEK